ncbi:hypothetical protein GCM10011529_00660 [Polymorphobacter glacialis]|uniref:Uncharacterized protein n=1 Tax=Sandarakinorhabdus glacialis TaxID=1614636 RepID=A0A916ZHN8_9SPHN|nr:hypothetical protein GCM10011529_00660 [Polymorphobacter glacialis]
MYRRAVDIARHARHWFDGPGLEWRATLPVADQAAVATESLRTTARMMAVIAWAVDPRHDKAPGAALPRFTSSAFTQGGSLPGTSPLLGTPGGDIAIASRQLVDTIVERTPIAQKPAPHSDGLWRI